MFHSFVSTHVVVVDVRRGGVGTDAVWYLGNG